VHINVGYICSLVLSQRPAKKVYLNFKGEHDWIPPVRPTCIGKNPPTEEVFVYSKLWFHSIEFQVETASSIGMTLNCIQTEFHILSLSLVTLCAEVPRSGDQSTILHYMIIHTQYICIAFSDKSPKLNIFGTNSLICAGMPLNSQSINQSVNQVETIQSMIAF